MKVKVIIETGIKEPYAVIYTNKMSTDIQETADKISNSKSIVLSGARDQKIYILDQEDIYCFFSENQKVFAKNQEGMYWVKYKLYELEEFFKGTSFVRISNSCIVNINKIMNLEVSFGGTICVNFKNGDKEYISRRYVSKIKEYLKI